MQNRYLIDFLTAGLKSAEERAKYQLSTQQLLGQKEYTRVFNAHVIKASEADRNKMKDLLFTDPLFGNPKLRKVQKNVMDQFVFSDGDDKKRVVALIDGIVMHACRELLDSQGYIKREIVCLLNWEDYREIIRNRAVVVQIVRSYVEVAFSAVSKSVITHMDDPDLLPVWACVTQIASDNYSSSIQKNIRKRARVDVIDDFAIQFLAALPKSTPEDFLRKLITQDIDFSQRQIELNNAYTTFWVHVLFEALAAKREDVFPVILAELKSRIIPNNFPKNLCEEYVFCHDQIIQMPKPIAVSGGSASAASAPRLHHAEQILAYRDNFVTIRGIHNDYSLVGARSFSDNDILGRLDQATSNLSLLARLQRASSECHMYGIANSALAKIIAKYTAHFADKMSTPHTSPSTSSTVGQQGLLAHSPVKTMNQVGLHKLLEKVQATGSARPDLHARRYYSPK